MFGSEDCVDVKRFNIGDVVRFRPLDELISEGRLVRKFGNTYRVYYYKQSDMGRRDFISKIREDLLCLDGVVTRKEESRIHVSFPDANMSVIKHYCEFEPVETESYDKLDMCIDGLL